MKALIHEVSPKFNCCKMEYLLILRFKGPLRFSMFRTRLSRKLAWPCVFLNGLRDFSCRAPFWRPCTFACVPARFFQSVFVAPLQHGHSSRGGSACMFLRMDGQCFWFCHLRVIAFSSRAKHMLQILVVVQAVCKNGSVLMRQPPAKVKNRQIAFVFCFGLPSVWERSTKLRIHRSHS